MKYLEAREAGINPDGAKIIRDWTLNKVRLITLEGARPVCIAQLNKRKREEKQIGNTD